MSALFGLMVMYQRGAELYNDDGEGRYYYENGGCGYQTF